MIVSRPVSIEHFVHNHWILANKSVSPLGGVITQRSERRSHDRQVTGLNPEPGQQPLYVKWRMTETFFWSYCVTAGCRVLSENVFSSWSINRSSTFSVIVTTDAHQMYLHYKSLHFTVRDASHIAVRNTETAMLQLSVLDSER